MHVCILTRSSPAANPRVVKEAAALRDAGYKVTAVFGAYKDWSRRFSEGALPKDCDVKFAVYGPSAPFPKRALQLTTRYGGRAFFRLGIRPAHVAFYANSDATAELYRAALSTPADLYIAHYTAALPAAAKAAARHGALYAFDAEDFHPGDLLDRKEHAFTRALIRSIEQTYLPHCAFITAAAPGIADAYAREYGLDAPTVVLNTFPAANAPPHPTESGVVRPGPSLYWFSQTIGPDRGLECAVRALALCRTRPHLYLRGNPSRAFVDRLYEIASEFQVRDRVHILDPAAPHEMERLASQFDVGLVSETGGTLNRQIALTNKQFTYLLAGIPVVMSDTPAHRAFASEAEGAVMLFRTEDPASLGQALDTILKVPAKHAAMRSRAFELGQQRFNWEIEQAKLIRRVDETLSVKRQATSAPPGQKAPTPT